jgi:hypothetical protein
MPDDAFHGLIDAGVLEDDVAALPPSSRVAFFEVPGDARCDALAHLVLPVKATCPRSGARPARARSPAPVTMLTTPAAARLLEDLGERNAVMLVVSAA